MPLEWKPGENPYAMNAFGVLGVGPDVRASVIVQLAKKLANQAKRGNPPKREGVELSENQVQMASKCLCADRTRAPELLLVHPQPERAKGKLKDAVAKVQEQAQLTEERRPLSLVHPMAAFWFVPRPGADLLPLPDLAEMALVRSGDAEDGVLDIVFDE